MASRRGIRFVFTLLVLAVVVSTTGMLFAYFMLARGPSIQADSTLVVRVHPGLTEYQPDTVVSQLVGAGTTVSSVVESLRKAKVDRRIGSVVLIPSGDQPLWGKLQELRDAIVDFQESGKPIVAYLEYGSGQQYYLATACDEIYLSPTSPLDVVGVASYEIFLRGALDKVGVYPDMLHAGEYKTASNVYTEKTFTPEHREMSESLNRDLYEQLIAAIAEGRQIPADEVRALVDQGPFLPEDALRLGLVDGLIYQDELADQISLGHAGERTIEDREYRRVNPRSLGLNRGRRIAIVYAVGTINFGESGLDYSGTQIAGSETLVEALRAARRDDGIEAIVLRVESPGGAAVASDLIWREVVLASQAKPVVASMSDLAASGGYYIAMPAHAIVAHPATLTGSIGVVGGKFALGGALDKLGVNIEAVSNGAQAQLASPVRPFSTAEREKLQRQIEAVYDRFVEKAADGRGMAPERIHEVAQGRVWTGRQAKEVGLVDELGGLDRALALAKEQADIPVDEEVELVVFPRPRGVLDLLERSIAFGGAREVFSLGPNGRRLTTLAAPLRLFRPGEPLAILPSALFR